MVDALAMAGELVGFMVTFGIIGAIPFFIGRHIYKSRKAAKKAQASVVREE